MNATVEEASKKDSLIEYIKFRLQDEMGQTWFNSAQMPVLDATPLPELEQLLGELRRRFTINDGAEAKQFCINKIYESKRKREEDEQRDFDAKFPLQEPLM